MATTIQPGQTWRLKRPSLAGYEVGATVRVTAVGEFDGVGYQYEASGARGMAAHDVEFRRYFEIARDGRTDAGRGGRGA